MSAATPANSGSVWILWLKIFGLLGLVIAGFGMLASVTVLFIPFLCAVILNVLLAPLVAKLERRGMPHGRAVSIVFLSLLAVLIFVGSLLPGYVQSEAAVLRAKWPQAKANIDKLLVSAEEAVNGMLPDDKQFAIVERVPHEVDKISSSVIAELPGFLSEGVVVLALIFVFSFFLLRDGRSLKRQIVAAVPNRYFEMTLNIIHKVNLQVSNYLRGLIIEALVDATIATLFCLTFSIPNALVIGLVVGLTTPIPVAGLVVSAVVCPLVAIFSGGGDPLTLTLLVWAAIGVAHLVDNIIVAPLIMGHSVHMHPVLIIGSIILGGKLFGVFGILLAVPTVSVLMVVIQEGYQGIKSNEHYLRASQ